MRRVYTGNMLISTPKDRAGARVRGKEGDEIRRVMRIRMWDQEVTGLYSEGEAATSGFLAEE